MKLMVSMLSPEEIQIEAAREELRQYVDLLCKEVNETDLPPFCAINHSIPLIDDIRKKGFGLGETQAALGNFFSPRVYLAPWASSGISGCL